MKLFIQDDEVIEQRIEDTLKSPDNGVVIKSQVGIKIGENRSDLTKEITALDSLEIGATKAGEINGVPQSSASKYAVGKDIADDETRVRVLNIRNQISDMATSKLMDTLDLFDPTDIEKPRELIAAARDLSTIVEKISGKGEKDQQVHLHMYMPNQNKVEKYEVIDV